MPALGSKFITSMPMQLCANAPWGQGDTNPANEFPKGNSE